MFINDLTRMIAAPVAGFLWEDQAEKYRNEPKIKPWLVGHANGERFYVAHRGLPRLYTDVLGAPRDFQHNEHPSKPVYRNSAGEPIRTVEGAFNTLLLMSGKRQVAFASRTRHKGLEQISWESRDCFVVWRDGEGNPFDQSTVSIRQTVETGHGENDKQEVVRSEAIAARRAHALLFSRRLHLEADPHPEDGMGINWLHQTHVVLLKVNVLDKNASKPDSLQLQVKPMGVSRGRNGEYEPCALPEQFDQSWHDMLAEAEAGFTRECTDCTPELKARYEEIMASARKTHAEISLRRTERSEGRRGYGRFSY